MEDTVHGHRHLIPQEHHHPVYIHGTKTKDGEHHVHALEDLKRTLKHKSLNNEKPISDKNMQAT